jgi:hypothetical protein
VGILRRGELCCAFGGTFKCFERFDLEILLLCDVQFGVGLSPKGRGSLVRTGSGARCLLIRGLS